MSPGSITFSSIYGGEDYDANLEQKGWDRAGFNDAKWKQIVVVDGPERLNLQMEEPVKAMEAFSHQWVNKINEGRWVYYFGRNASGYTGNNC